jgi:hypothetical protein
LQQTVCRTFSRSGWSVVRSASLAKGGTSKKRSSSHLHKAPNQSNKVSPRTFQTAVVYNRFNCLHDHGMLKKVKQQMLLLNGSVASKSYSTESDLYKKRKWNTTLQTWRS